MTRRFVIFATTALIVLGVVMWQLGLRARNELQAVATGQFNQQQLILADKVAQDIEKHFSFLGASLLELNSIWRRYPSLMAAPSQALPAFQEILRKSEVLAVGYVPPGSHTVALYGEDGLMTGSPILDYAPFIAWARSEQMGQDVLYGAVEAPEQGLFAGRTIVAMAARQWPADGASGEPGILFLIVDALGVARRYAHDVRSGQSGYAWVLDQRGFFLDHHEEDFIAQDAFAIRKKRDPNVDFSRVDAIMRRMMASASLGTDWYVSGWHRESKGEVRKLIAYVPLEIAPRQRTPLLWSVAVVAPVDEVEGIIGTVAMREMLMVAAFQVVVFLGLAVTMYFALRWSATLKREVEARTAELREARDKIRLSLNELLATQERLIRSERFAAIGEAAAHISHEIKNPLIVMGGFARQVRRTLAPESKEAHKLALIEGEAQRLQTMLEDVRDFTRPNPPRLSQRDLNATAWETAMLMESDLAAKSVVLTTTLDQSLPPATHDPGQIRQVLLNLIKNASEAMPHGGHVTIGSRPAGGAAELEVRDNGPGLTPEQAKQVFHPFYTTKEQGTGLGLSVCYRIMQDHGGDIRLETLPGKGCAFILSLPVDAGAAVAGQAPA